MLRTYFNFLDRIIGRGLFLIFLALMLCEKQNQGEVIIAIVVICVGIVDIVLGWEEEKRIQLPKDIWSGSSTSQAAPAAKAAGA